MSIFSNNNNFTLLPSRWTYHSYQGQMYYFLTWHSIYTSWSAFLAKWRNPVFLCWLSNNLWRLSTPYSNQLSYLGGLGGGILLAHLHWAPRGRCRGYCNSDEQQKERGGVCVLNFGIAQDAAEILKPEVCHCWGLSSLGYKDWDSWDVWEFISATNSLLGLQ